MPGLEDEIKKMLWRETVSDPKLLEALVTGEEVQASVWDVLGVVIQKQNALEQAVLRIAREIDES